MPYHIPPCGAHSTASYDSHHASYGSQHGMLLGEQQQLLTVVWTAVTDACMKAPLQETHETQTTRQTCSTQASCVCYACIVIDLAMAYLQVT